jgi:hypothetical protein
MAKRFTDTDKWKKGWFKQLNSKQRLFWLYILDDCNAAGIWDVDLEVASIRIGDRVGMDEAVEVLGEDVIWFDNNEKIFIPKFIEFQYGVLNENSRPHASVIKILEKYKLYGNQTPEISEPKPKIRKSFNKPTVEKIQEYCKERNNTVDGETFFDFYESKGWMVGKTKMKDWKAAVRNWERSDNVGKSGNFSGGKVDKQISNWQKARDMISKQK